jgi:hypothetical protein
MFGQLMGSLGIATPKILALCSGQVLTWLDPLKTEPLERLVDHDCMQFFLKDLIGENANYVHCLKVQNRKLYAGADEIPVDKLKDRMPPKCILQELIQQHPDMAILHPASVNTIRLITTNIKGKVQLFGDPLVRMGCNLRKCDNWAIGGLVGRIDLASDRLSRYCFYKPGYGGRTTRHPDTGIVFEDFRVPFVKEAIALAVLAHGFLDGLHSIGWDIAITPAGPMLIEGNDNWEISLFQSLHGGLRRAFLATLQHEA